MDLDPAGEHLAAHAVVTPDRAAVVMHPSGHIRTYADLERTSVRLAHALRARGLGRGDHLAVLLDNQPEFFDVVGVPVEPLDQGLGLRILFQVEGLERPGLVQ